MTAPRSDSAHGAAITLLNHIALYSMDPRTIAASREDVGRIERGIVGTPPAYVEALRTLLRELQERHRFRRGSASWVLEHVMASKTGRTPRMPHGPEPRLPRPELLEDDD